MHFPTVSYYDDAGRVRVFRAMGDSFTVGSDAICDLTIAGLPPTACRIYRAEDGYFLLDLGGGVVIEDRPGPGYLRDGGTFTLGGWCPGYLRDGGTFTLGGWLSLRFAVEPDRPSPVGDHRRPQGSAARAPAAAVAGGARGHRPATAVALGVLPGGGQAYNGEPFKGVFFLLTSALVLPWVWSLLDARAVARRVAAAGGRRGRGGLLWFVLHGWLALNLALLTLLVLTLAGVLS